MDLDSGAPTNQWLDRGVDLKDYFYSIVDDPSTGRDEFRSTAEPGRYLHIFNHQNVSPGTMLDPPVDRTLHGTVCIVEGTVTVAEPLPRKTGDPPTTVNYNILPLETQLASVGDPVVVEIWDPRDTYPYSYRKEWVVSNLSGSIAWDGMLDEYYLGDLIESDVSCCRASTLFAKITIKVEDTCWMWGGVQTMIDEFEFEMPRIAITIPDYDSLFPVCEPITFHLVKSATVEAPLSGAEWEGGGDIPDGVGETFMTTFRVSLGVQTIEATLETAAGQLQTATKVRIYGIDKLEWIALPNGGEVVSGGEGQAIFPGWTGDDMIQPENNRPDRRRVAIRATLNLPIPNEPVYFHAIDIDDPSYAKEPVDPNDNDIDGEGNPKDDDGDGNNIDGDDNRGGHGWSSDQNGAQGRETSFYVIGDLASKETDNLGVASVIFEVSLKPGDNYRGVASLGVGQEYKPGAPQGEQPTVYYVYNDESRFFPDWPDRFTWATDTNITVWRKLWYEFGSMLNTPKWDDGELVFGPETGTSTQLSENTLHDTSKDWANNAFDQDDTLYPNTDGLGGGGKFWISDNGDTWVEVQGEDLDEYASVGDPYKIMTQDHDCGDIPEPGGDLLAGAFVEAFVLPVVLPANLAHPQRNNIPWAHYASDIVDYTKDYSKKALNNCEKFWQLWAFGAFEYGEGNDGDGPAPGGGSSEVVYFGVTDRSLMYKTEGSAIYREVNVDETDPNERNFRWSQTTLHELGHQMSLKHEDGEDENGNPAGVMYKSPETIVVSHPAASHFTEKSVSKIRSISKPE